jgi:hypothetical protein
MSYKTIKLQEHWLKNKNSVKGSMLECPVCKTMFIKNRKDKIFCKVECTHSYYNSISYDDQCKVNYRKEYYKKENGYRENHKKTIIQSQKEYSKRSKIGNKLTKLNIEELIKFASDIHKYKPIELSKIWNCSVYYTYYLKDKYRTLIKIINDVTSKNLQ